MVGTEEGSGEGRRLFNSSGEEGEGEGEGGGEAEAGLLLLLLLLLGLPLWLVPGLLPEDMEIRPDFSFSVRRENIGLD